MKINVDYYRQTFFFFAYRLCYTGQESEVNSASIKMLFVCLFDGTHV
jgi:hypothetical protein